MIRSNAFGAPTYKNLEEVLENHMLWLSQGMKGKGNRLI